MKKINDGGPAFPRGDYHPNGNGMSLRDWFAGTVDAQGYEFPDLDVAARALNIDPPFDESFDEVFRFSLRAQAAIRYALADAMLAARERRP